MTTDNDGPIVRPTPAEKPRFMRSDLKDFAFYRANEQAILEAAREGRILDDVTPNKRKWGKDFGRPSK